MESIYPVFEQTDAKTLDFLLRRDWFVDDEAILDELDWADQDAWDYVVEHRERYAPHIRELIQPTKYPVKMRVVDLTDELQRKMDVQAIMAREAECDAAWDREKAHVPERPHQEIDSDLDDAWEALTKAKESTKTYLPPAKMAAAREKVTRLENEYKRLEERAEQADRDYLESYKNDFKATWMRQL